LLQHLILVTDDYCLLTFGWSWWHAAAGHVRAGVEQVAGGRYVLPDDDAGLAQQSVDVF